MRIDNNTNLAQIMMSGDMNAELAALASEQNEGAHDTRRAGRAEREAGEATLEQARAAAHARAAEKMWIQIGTSAASGVVSAVGGASGAGASSSLGHILGGLNKGVEALSTGLQGIVSQGELDNDDRRAVGERTRNNGNETVQNAQDADRIAASTRDTLRQLAQTAHQAEMAALRG